MLMEFGAPRKSCKIRFSGLSGISKFLKCSKTIIRMAYRNRPWVFDPWFLTSKSKIPSFYLIVIPSNEKLKIKELEKMLNEKLSFANEQDLKHQLNLTSGSVSIFSLLNNQNTTLILSEKIYNSQFVSFHPNINTETLELSKNNFHIFLDSIKNKKLFISPSFLSSNKQPILHFH